MTSSIPLKHVNGSASSLVWRSGTLKIGAHELAWEESGPHSGAPLLLLAGLTMQLTHWADAFVRPLVAEGFRVIRYDHRDMGLSSSANRGIRFDLRRDIVRSRLRQRIAANYTLYDLAEDAVGLMNALDVPSAHLVGVSMGGMIAQIVSAKHPGRVRSLTSIMSNTNEPWLPPPSWAVMRQMFFTTPKDRSREMVVRHTMTMMRLLGSPGFPTPEAELRVIAEHSYDRADRPGGALRQTHAILATGGFAHLLGNITAPTRVIHGTADPLVRPFGGKRSASLIRGAELELIEGMGHDLPAALLPRLASSVLSNVARV